MSEENPSTQTTPEPTTKSEPQKEGTPKKEPDRKTAPKKKSGLFQKIPTDVILSPGGMIIVFVAIIVEIIGIIIPIPVIGFLIQLPFVIILYVLLMTIGGLSFKSLILVPIIELFFPFLPTWLIRIFI